MGSELFLILLTLCAAFINRKEIAPALLFTAVAHLFYFVATGLSDNTLLVLNLSMLMEMVTVILLVCLKGCLRSKLISFLIPISILAIFMHLYGVFLFVNEYSIAPYNSLVKIYWVTILGLFLSMSRWMDGSNIKSARLLRKHGSESRVI